MFDLSFGLCLEASTSSCIALAFCRQSLKHAPRPGCKHCSGMADIGQRCSLRHKQKLTWCTSQSQLGVATHWPMVMSPCYLQSLWSLVFTWTNAAGTCSVPCISTGTTKNFCSVRDVVWSVWYYHKNWGCLSADIYIDNFLWLSDLMLLGQVYSPYYAGVSKLHRAG